MVSSIIIYSTRPKALLILIIRLILISSFSLPYGSANATHNLLADGELKITDYKNFKIILYRSRQLTVSKINTDISYINGDKQFHYRLSKFGKQHSYTTESISHRYFLGIKNTNLSFFTTTKISQYLDRFNQICLDKSVVLTKSLLSMTEELADNSVVNLIDKKSCEDTGFNLQLKLALRKYFDNYKNTILSCLNNNTARELIAKDASFGNLSTNIMSNYTNLVKKILSSNSILKVTCNNEVNNSFASLNENLNPTTINFNSKKILAYVTDEVKLSPTLSFNKVLNNTIQSALEHELLHFSQKQTPFISYQECKETKGCEKLNEESIQSKNEKSVVCYQQFCSQSELNQDQISTQSVKDYYVCTGNNPGRELKKSIEHNVEDPTSKNVRDKTQADKSMSSDTQANNSYSPESSNASQTTATQTKQEKINLANQNAKVEAALGKTVKSTDWVQLPPSTFTKLQAPTNPNPQYGKPYQISANSDYGKLVQQTMQAFQKSDATITTKLNAALSAVSNPAVATTPTTLAGSRALPTAAPSTAINSGTTSEKLTEGNTTITAANRNQNQLPGVANDAAMAARTPASLPNSPDTTYSNSPVTANGKMAVPSGSGNLDGASNQISGMASRSGGSFSSGGIAGGSGGGSTSREAAGYSDNSGSSSPTPARIDQVIAVTQSVQALKAFSSLSGPRYDKVRKYYSDTEFDGLLKKYDIRIMVKTPNGQYRAVGQLNDKAKRVFNDDGQNLQIIKANSK